MDRQEMKQKKMMGAILPGNSTVELREFDMPKPIFPELWQVMNLVV